MNDPNANPSGPNGASEGGTSTEWSFDLDEALMPIAAAGDVADARTGGNSVSTTTMLSADVSAPAAMASQDIDANALAGRQFDSQAPSHSRTVIDGANGVTPAAAGDNTTSIPFDAFQADQLIFDDDSLIG